MAPTLYMVPASPPVRSVLMTAKSIGLELTLKEVNPMAQENMKPEYLKLNPQHTIPTLVDDDGFTVWDSHAIMAYLVSKYAKDDALYPKDLKKRAVIDQRLHFDSGVTWAKIIQVLKPAMGQGRKTVSQADTDMINEVYAFVEAFLDGHQWIAGDSLSIADFSYITSMGTIIYFVPIDGQKFPKLVAYLKKAESLPEYEANKKGLEALEERFKRLVG